MDGRRGRDGDGSLPVSRAQGRTGLRGGGLPLQELMIILHS